MPAYPLGLGVLLTFGAAGIVFLIWVLVHLHKEGKENSPLRLSKDLEKARDRIQSSWAPVPGIGNPGQSMKKGRILRRMAAKKIPPNNQAQGLRDSRARPARAQSPRTEL